MKKVFIILLILASTNGFAQLNIIKDGSFEDTTNVWQGYTSARCLHHWNAIDTSTLNNMYFINLWIYMSTQRIQDTFAYKLPYSFLHRQYPKYGQGAIDFVPYEDKTKTANFFLRSIVRGYLQTKLISGKQYCATIYATAEERPGFFVTNGLGLYFDNGQIDTVVKIHKDSSGILDMVTPQVQCNFLINDTINWMKIQSVFTANGTETNVTIANFLNDSVLLKQVNFGGTVPYWYTQNMLIDNVSLIPLDITKWLPTTYTTANADSVWVGLDAFDYADGKWYTSNMQYITTGPGFWLKGGSIEAGKKFIHEIDVCGVLRYDTTEVVVAPVAISNEQFAMNNLKVWPNPATDAIQVSNVAGDKVGLYNTVGQLVLVQNAVQNKVSMQVGHLPKGVYVVKTVGQIAKVVIR
jgi:Secretion system C-terminal sorting domain